MKELTFKKAEKPSWADKDIYLNIYRDNIMIGSIGLISVATMKEASIKRVNVAFFEIDFDKLVPYESRTNEFKHLPLFPLVEKDLSILVSEETTWDTILESIKKMVKSVEFIEEYKGDKIPEGKKSLTFRVKMGKDDSTMNSEEINNKVKAILKALKNSCDAILREE